MTLILLVSASFMAGFAVYHALEGEAAWAAFFTGIAVFNFGSFLQDCIKGK